MQASFSSLLCLVECYSVFFASDVGVESDNRSPRCGSSVICSDLSIPGCLLCRYLQKLYSAINKHAH